MLGYGRHLRKKVPVVVTGRGVEAPEQRFEGVAVERLAEHLAVVLQTRRTRASRRCGPMEAIWTLMASMMRGSMLRACTRLQNSWSSVRNRRSRPFSSRPFHGLLRSAPSEFGR